jgi:multidrug efflux system outer membrane protein
MKDALMKYRPIRHGVAAAVLAALLAGCVSAPAKLDHPPLRTDVPLAGLQAPVGAGWPDAAWWRVYHDRQLDRLIELAVLHSPDLKQAHSRVQNAEQSARLAATQAGLTVNGNAQFERQRLSNNGIISLLPKNVGIEPWYNQSDIGLQARYTFDWWGKQHATIAAALDQARAAEAQRGAAALTLQNAVAEMYFGWQGDQAQLAIASQLVDLQQKLLRIAELRVAQGVDLADTVQQARAQLASARSSRLALAGSADVRKVALAALLGIAPAKLPILHPEPLPAVDSRLPVDARLDLIARRPDIAASRWQVESALRRTEVARAQFFPDISLTALAGLSSIDTGKLLQAGSRTFAVTPALHLPIFEGGQLQANYGISRAQLDSAVAQYDSTVIGAARDVATQALTAAQIAARQQQQAELIQADQRLLDTAQARTSRGITDARESLTASMQLLLQRDTAAALQAQAVSTNLALIKALGGGYRMPAGARSTSPASLPTASGDDTHEHR